MLQFGSLKFGVKTPAPPVEALRSHQMRLVGSHGVQRTGSVFTIFWGLPPCCLGGHEIYFIVLTVSEFDKCRYSTVYLTFKYKFFNFVFLAIFCAFFCGEFLSFRSGSVSSMRIRHQEVSHNADPEPPHCFRK